jgi:hypothetical protein
MNDTRDAMSCTTLQLGSTGPVSLHLRRRQLLVVPDASQVRLSCDAGSVWVTLDHDQRDIVLEAGDFLPAADRRRALVYALEAARLTLRPRTDEAENSIELEAWKKTMQSLRSQPWPSR